MAILVLGITAAKAQQRIKTIFRYGEEIKIEPDTAVKIKKLTVTPKEGKVYLSWVVFNNMKNGMYVIERSIDGNNFEVIGFKKGIPTSLPLDLTFYYSDNIEVNEKITYRVIHIAEDNTYFEFPEVDTVKKNSLSVAILAPVFTSGEQLIKTP